MTPEPDELRPYVDRIREALFAARAALAGFVPGAVAFELKEHDDPVSVADRRVDTLLREILLRDGEGWLSEETADDRARLQHERVWIVDPIDGTREYVAGIPEWCVSIGWCVGGEAVAGGVLNPVAEQVILGARGLGVTLNGAPARVRDLRPGDPLTVLVSRSELKRGDWDEVRDGRLAFKSCGSVAYKLALVAAGLADATWTPQPKSEWDIAAGVALLLAAGGEALLRDGERPVFNKDEPRVPNLLGCPASIAHHVHATWFAGHDVPDCRRR